MPGGVSRVRDMDIDEVSTVGTPAAPLALMLIQKNYQEAEMPGATEEVPEVLFDRAGNQLPADFDFEGGEVVYDEAGNAFTVSFDDIEEAANDGQLVGAGAEIGKSAFLAGRPGNAPTNTVAKALADELRTALSKSSTGVSAEIRDLLSKSADAISKADERAARAEEIAKSERRIRLEGQFVEVAKAYNVPADPNELGPVLMRMAEALDDKDCAVIHKALTAAGSIIFEEIGITGGGTANGEDPMEQAEQFAAGKIAKSAGSTVVLSKAAAVTEYYTENPQAYEDYLASKAR